MLPLSEVVNYVWKTAYRFEVTEYKTMEEKVCYVLNFSVIVSFLDLDYCYFSLA